MIWFGLAAGLVVLVLMARLFFGAARSAERPNFVIEKPAFPKKWAPVVDALDRWKEAGRISREDHERLMALVREESGLDVRP